VSELFTSDAEVAAAYRSVQFVELAERLADAQRCKDKVASAEWHSDRRSRVEERARSHCATSPPQALRLTARDAPRYARCMTTQVAIRLSREQAARLDRAARGLRETRSEVVRRAVELYLYRLECEHDARVYQGAPLDDAELAFADDPKAWKGTPSW
jgi:predicted transcriptional regulator